MTLQESTTRARAGRPRDPACDAAILRATLEAFTEFGYAGVSMEGVAARAGVGKSTLYRRYATKAHLVVEAVRCGAQMDDDLPDTGDLRADLLTMMRPLLARLRSDEGQVLVTFAAERVRNPDLAEEFDRLVIGKKREHLRRLVRDAVERGDLPRDADVDLIAEAPPAYLWHHALYGLPLTDDLLDRILDLVLP
ncbi:MAG TPA: TetR/AcrR family transcriptional regulator [Acidimicrobiales bacterium]|nr:TetR/AcrR family transcriptional regulator [Acidimicrobiales bacterium]